MKLNFAAGWGTAVGVGVFRGIAILGSLLPSNFSPVGGLALFGSARAKSVWIGLSMPVVAMLVSDAMREVAFRLGWLAWPAFTAMTPVVYGSLLLIGLLGIGLRNVKNPALIGMGALGASAIFFLATNFAAWVFGSGIAGGSSLENMYAPTWDGLVACYVAALPFFQYTLIADLVFVPVFFGAHAAVEVLTTQAEAPETIRIERND